MHQDEAPRSSPDSGQQLTRAAGLVGLLTLASRVLGLVRDAVVAALFDKGATDAFFVAFTIPNVLRRLLAEGALTVAFIPVFTEYRQRHGEVAARSMLSSTLGVTLLTLVLVTAAGVLFAPQVVLAFAFGLAREPARFELAVLLTRILFAFLVTIGLTALAGGTLNTYRHFAAPAVAPVVLNVVIIGTVFAFAARMPAWGMHPTVALAVGVVLGGLAQLALQLPPLARRQMLVWPRLDFKHPAVRRIALLMAPAVFALGIYQINVMLARQFASFLPEGSISYVYYAQRLIEFPIGIFAVALATVSMPSLSSHATAGDLGRLRDTLRYALRLVFFIMLPATAGLAVLSVPLTSVLFQRGQFTHFMAQQTAWTLVGFTAGLWAAGGMRQVVQVFYATQDTRTPVKVSALCLFVFGGSAWALYRPLGTFGLALAVSLSSAVNFVLLSWLLRRRLGGLGLRAVLHSAARSAVGSLVCGSAAWVIARAGHWELGASGYNLAVLTAAVLVGIAAYVAVCYVLRVQELGELARALRRRRKRP